MNIFLGNLSYNVDEDDILGIFEEYGTVKSAKIITDRETGKSKGFGFVEMVDEEAGKKAIKELHEGELDGRHIIVNEAKPKEKKNFRSNNNNNKRRF